MTIDKFSLFPCVNPSRRQKSPPLRRKKSHLVILCTRAIRNLAIKSHKARVQGVCLRVEFIAQRKTWCYFDATMYRLSQRINGQLITQGVDAVEDQSSG